MIWMPDHDDLAAGRDGSAAAATRSTSTHLLTASAPVTWPM
jgi:hypothetical protein